MKKSISLILSIAMLLTLFINNIYATEITEVPMYEYTEQDLINLAEKERIADEMYETYKDMLNNQGISLRVIPSTNTYTIPVNVYKQEKNNWCGAAAIVQTLSFHKTKSGSSTALPTQGTIASKLGIYSSGGAASTTMASVLNQYKSSFGYTDRTYSATDIADKTNAFEWLYSRLRASVINQTYAPIVLIQTGNLTGIKRYYDEGISCRHYVTIGGIRETVDLQGNNIMSREIQTVDPHYNSAVRGKYWDESSTVYQSMLRADNNGTNKVLIY